MKNKTKCVHDLNSNDCSLIKLPKRYLVHPEVIDAYCPVCHKVFRYKKSGTVFVFIKDE